MVTSEKRIEKMFCSICRMEKEVDIVIITDECNPRGDTLNLKCKECGHYQEI